MTSEQQLDRELEALARDKGKIGGLDGFSTIHELAAAGYVNFTAGSGVVTTYSAPELRRNGRGYFTEPSPMDYAMMQRDFVKLDLNEGGFRQAYLTDGKVAVDCSILGCPGRGPTSTGDMKPCTFMSISGGRKIVWYATSVCSVCGNKIKHIHRGFNIDEGASSCSGATATPWYRANRACGREFHTTLL
jgi:hypothetical protein